MLEHLEKKSQEFKLYIENVQTELNEKHCKETEQLKNEHETFINLIKTDYEQKIDQLNLVKFELIKLKKKI